MTPLEISGLILGIIGVIGTGVSIYQWAQINANKERLKEVQYVLAALNSSAVMKQIAWQNQFSLYANPTDEKGKELFRVHLRARDDFADLAQLASALEGTISATDSAMTAVSKKAIEQQELNNQFQASQKSQPGPQDQQH